jgi:hypothetical protein
MKTNNAEGGPPDRENKELASCKYIEPKDITKIRKDGYGNGWKFCTKCTCKVTDKKEIYQLSHADSEHKYEQVAPKAEENLTKIDDDPSDAIPLVHPVLATTEPGSGTGGEDEITFTGAWYTPVVPVDDGGIDEGITLPVDYCSLPGDPVYCR